MKNTICLILFLSFCLITACSDEKPRSKRTSTAKKEVKKEAPTKKKMPKKEAQVVKEKEEEAEPVPPEQIEKAKEIIANVSDDQIEAVDAKAKYKMLCAICHGFKGDANVNGAKDLTISKIGLEESVAQVYHGRGLMTPFKGIMKDEEIVAVAKYIETLRR